MVRMHQSLQRKITRIVDTPVRFSKKDECFVVEGRRKHGLTKFLASLVPVPFGKKEDAPGAVVVAAVPVCIEQFRGSVMVQCGCCRSSVASLRAKGDEFAARLNAEKNLDKVHGMVVDHQLELYTKLGRDALFQLNQIIDPCVGTMIEQFDKNDWTVIGAQVPIFDKESDVATAIDVLATDRATRKRLFLIEVKASRPGRSQDDNYERVRGILKRTALRELPQSYHARHQLQLLFMQQTLEREMHVTPDRSVVMRVSPGTVRTYDLAQEFSRRAGDIMRAVGECQKRKKRPKKKRAAPKAKK